MNELKIIIWSFIFIVLGGIVLLDVMFWISAKIKNKAQKRARQQIKHKSIKIDFCKNLVRNMQQDFIGQRQVIFNELVRM